MTVSKFTDLRCWQLADSLRKDVISVCGTERVAREFKFRENFLSAAGSVCNNISEGFGRFGSAEILRFFGYALASLAEVQDQLNESRDRKFIDADAFDRYWDKSEHIRASMLNFMKPHQEKVRNRRTRATAVDKRKPQERKQ
jgi:four helix bundle protein